MQFSPFLQSLPFSILRHGTLYFIKNFSQKLLTAHQGFLWIALTLGVSHASATQYESHLRASPTETRHYYLTDEIENTRRVFHLFHAKGAELQDLLERKSFSLDEQSHSEAWLQQAIKKYELKSQSAYQKSLSLQEFYPFSQLQYFSHPDDTKPSLRPALPQAPSSNSSPFLADPSTSSMNPTPFSAESPPLWEAQNEWSTEWEMEYGRWVETTLHPNFMVDIKLPTDCADVAYLLRWVFAYIHKLPMAARLGGSGQLFTNETMKPEWLQLPTDPDWKKDLRFRAALVFLLRNTYTHTLMKDSYPVPLNPEKFTPGTHHLELHSSSGHTMIVNKVNDPNGLPITMLFSTMPIRIRELISTFYQNYETPKLYNSGFYKIRWAKKMESGWHIIPAKALPDYSEEQFRLGSDQGDEANKMPHFIKVFKRLNPQFSFETILSKSYEELQARINDRIQVVEEGYAYCQVNDCSPGSTGDEDWSTPNRDKRLKGLHDSMNLAAQFLTQYEVEVAERWKKLLAEKAQEKSFTIAGKNYSLQQIVIALIYNLTQTDPRLNIDQRWGLSPSEGYGPTLIKTLEKTVSERKNLIQRAEVCRQKQCKEKSEDFRKLNTMILDDKILNLWAGAQSLCQASEPNDCVFLRNLLQSQSLDQKNYYEWYSQVPLWISNPNASLERRWGEQGKSFAFTSPTNQHNAAFSSQDNQWFTINSSLMKTSDLSKVSFSANEVMGQLHYASGMYFTYERHEAQLLLRFYSTPQTLLSEVTLRELPTAPLRLWWSSPSKETLSVFSGTHFYELDSKSGTIIKNFAFRQFHHLPMDPRITIIETEQGLMMSDAQSDASHFSAFPFPINKLLHIYEVQRTQLGWLLRSAKKLYYVEKDSQILIDWDLTYLAYTFINPEATTLLRKDSEEKIEVFQRNQNSPDSSTSPFRLIKTIPGSLRGIVPDYFTVSRSLNRDATTTTYSMKTLEPIALSCENPKAQSAILSNDYYLCSDNKQKELHHISGRLLTTTESNVYWFRIQDIDSAINSTHDWLIASKFLSSVSGPDNYILSYAEIHALTPQSLDGPYLQSINYDGNFNSNFNLIDGEMVLVNPINIGIAPPALPLHLNTNFGLAKPLPYLDSFLLSAVAEKDLQGFVVLLP